MNIQSLLLFFRRLLKKIDNILTLSSYIIEVVGVILVAYLMLELAISLAW